jgi:hypothetical protein
MQIFPGSVFANAAGRQCTVGPLVRCEDNWYTFAPAHTFEGEKKVFQAGTGLLVGEIVSDQRSGGEDTRVDITEAVRLVRLFSYAQVQVEKSRRVRCVDPLDFLGEKVLKRDGIATISGSVASVDGPFATADQDGGVKTYYGAFSVKPEYNDVIMAKNGDGGSSIVSPGCDALVGVLIGVAGEECYCVPGDMLIARYFPDFENLEMVA